MSYRKQKSTPEQAGAWNQWIQENRSTLERIGLPLAAYQDSAHWEDFLENGHLHSHSDGPPFDFTDLVPGQMEQLWAFLERHVADQQRSCSLLRWLRVRLGKKQPE